MNSPVLQAFPAFRLRPPADGSASAEVVDANDVVVGQVAAAGGAYRGRVGTDAGPGARTLRGRPKTSWSSISPCTPRPTQSTSRTPVSPRPGPRSPPIPLQRQEIVDSAARAYFFHALRQQHVAAILDGLEAIVREHDAPGTRGGCLRVVRLLDQVRETARALLSEATGDEREWMSFPHAADQALATAFRTYRDVQAGTRTLASLPDDALHALAALDAAAAQLPSGPCAKNRADCRAAASAPNELATAVRSVEASAPDIAPEVRALAQELSAIATDTSARLESTALLLEDAGRHGSVRTILSALQDAELGPETDAGTRSVRVDDTETGPIRHTENGRWTGPGITDPYHSPEGAAAALINTFRDRQATARTRV
ncbi:hypothetical protein ACWEFD_31920 [Streptomyces ardesiacus]